MRFVLERWASAATLDEAAARCAAPSSSLTTNPDSWRLRVMHLGAGRGHTGLRGARSPKLFAALGPTLDALPGPVDLSAAAAHDVAVVYDADEPSCDVGRVVAAGSASARLEGFRVADRRYRGSTTMDAELAFIMARLANVREGDAVLDPFCGTGGCLLACAAYGGARGFGADCDARVLLRGTSHWDEASGRLPLRENDRLRHALASQLAKDGRREPRRGEVSDRVCSIAGNFADRGLPAPRLVVSDVADLDERLDDERYYFDDVGGATAPQVFDAIVTDPPYGKRERIAGGDARWLEELLGLADDALKVGGRCVFFVPHGDDASADDVAARVAARAPGYAVEASAQQRLSGPWRRTLVVLRKETSAARSTKGGARDDLGAELSDYWKGRRAAVEAGRGTRGTH